jgi:ElaB/YqjD/DUF883 family membrane-anchored ribosome-binding protein
MATFMNRSDELTQLRPLKQDFQNLSMRYNVILELAGEKDEEIEDLKSDMAQMKELFRKQLDDATREIAQLKSRIK